MVSRSCNLAPLALVLAAAACSGNDTADDSPQPARDETTPVNRAPESRGESHVSGSRDAGGAQGPAEHPPALAFEEIELDPGLDRPTGMAFVPGSEDELLVIEQDRRIVHLRLSGRRAERLGSVELPRAQFVDDCGLIDIVFDPGFADNGFLFVSMCVSTTASGIFRLRWEGELALLGETLTEILLAGDERATRGRHNVGALGFDADGRLWTLFGEKTRSGNADDLGDPLGGAVLLEPSRDPEGQGSSPAGESPFFDAAGADPTLYAAGLRSPWRGAIDARGRLWVGDVGEADYEEVNLIAAPGERLGWPAYEGPCPGDCDGLTQPITSWHRDEHDYVLDDVDARPTTRTVVWVGEEYQDRGNDRYDGALTGRMLIADMCVGFVRLLEANADNRLTLDIHVGHLAFLSGIDQSDDGYFYVTTFGACETETVSDGAGRLYRVVQD